MFWEDILQKAFPTRAEQSFQSLSAYNLLCAVQGVHLSKVHLLAVWQVHSEAHYPVRLVVCLKRKQSPHDLRRKGVPGVEILGNIVPVIAVRHAVQLHPGTVMLFVSYLYKYFTDWMLAATSTLM